MPVAEPEVAHPLREKRILRGKGIQRGAPPDGLAVRDQALDDRDVRISPLRAARFGDAGGGRRHARRPACGAEVAPLLVVFMDRQGSQ
jgi:hypothetical protein